MFEIQQLVERVSRLKYPDGPTVLGLQQAFQLDVYVTIGRSIECGDLLKHTAEQVVEHCAARRLSRPDGIAFTREQAELAVGAIALGLRTGIPDVTRAQP